MAASESAISHVIDTKEDYRVKLTSKREVVDQLDRYNELLKAAMDGQPEDVRTRLLDELLANFEAAVQDNVLVNSLPWEKARDVGAENKALDPESLLDDTMVETTNRRRTYPKKILPHVIHALRLQRKLMELYKPTVNPQDDVKDPDQERMMDDLSDAATGTVKQAIQAIKSINTLQKQAEDLCTILNMKQSKTFLAIHSEVFGSKDQLDAPGATWNKQPIIRAIEEAVAADGYIPPAKKLLPVD